LGETTLVVAADDRNRRKYRRQRAQHYPALIATEANFPRNRCLGLVQTGRAVSTATVTRFT
jgi:hypothetical protein